MKEAQELIEAYDERWKGVKAYHKREAEKTEKGIERTTTVLGRVRKISLGKSRRREDMYTVYLPEWINHQVQGSAGDGIKLSMANIYRARHDLPGDPLLVDAVHDELVIECDRDQRKEVARRIEEIMISSMCEVLGVRDAPVRVKTEIATDYSAVKEVVDE